MLGRVWLRLLQHASASQASTPTQNGAPTRSQPAAPVEPTAPNQSGASRRRADRPALTTAASARPRNLQELALYLRDQAGKLRHMVAAWNDRPSIYVMGLAKHGKSTLVNALVGEAVAKPDLVIRTWRVDIYTASEAKSVEILWKDGRRTQHSVDEARTLLDEEEQRFEASEARVRSEYHRLLRLHGSSLSRAERLELRARLERLYLYRSPITHVRWSCRPGRVLNRFNVVDTPGLKQAGVAEPSTADEFYP